MEEVKVPEEIANLPLDNAEQAVESTERIKPQRLNKTEKKFQKYQSKILRHREKKAQKKQLNQLKRQLEAQSDAPRVESNTDSEPKKTYDNFLSKRDLKARSIERLRQVYTEGAATSLKICIDCSFSNIMSSKEMARLAQQIGRCYATNKSISSPVHLTLCNLDENSKFYKELCRINDGFANYIIEKSDKNVESLFVERLDTIAYLSPDAKTNLETLDVNKTYLIGGLVDETVNKQVTINKCTQLKINAYSLPIEKYMSRRKFGDGETGYNYNKILAINQVFDILANYFISNDWTTALEGAVPKRKGFFVDKTQSQLN